MLLLDNDLATTTTTEFNKIMTDTADEVLGKHRRRTKPWVTDRILKMCDKRREAKKKKDITEGRKEYAKMNRDIRMEMKTAKQKWIEDQFKEIEEDLQNNNTKKALQKIKTLTKDEKGSSSTIQAQNGKVLTEEEDIHKRWTE